MDGGQITAIVIVAIVMVGSIIRSGIRLASQKMPGRSDDGQARAENRQLRDEVSQLKERIKVLERITVEKENSLSREIDDLRDR